MLGVVLLLLIQSLLHLLLLVRGLIRVKYLSLNNSWTWSVHIIRMLISVFLLCLVLVLILRLPLHSCPWLRSWSWLPNHSWLRWWWPFYMNWHMHWGWCWFLSWLLYYVNLYSASASFYINNNKYEHSILSDG